MSKKQARRLLAQIKHGCTVKEFLYYADDMMIWFDNIQGTICETIYYTLKS